MERERVNNAFVLMAIDVLTKYICENIILSTKTILIEQYILSLVPSRTRLDVPAMILSEEILYRIIVLQYFTKNLVL